MQESCRSIQSKCKIEKMCRDHSTDFTGAFADIFPCNMNRLTVNFVFGFCIFMQSRLSIENETIIDDRPTLARVLRFPFIDLKFLGFRQECEMSVDYTDGRSMLLISIKRFIISDTSNFSQFVYVNVLMKCYSKSASTARSRSISSFPG